jgi:hypothetical protein
MDEKKSLPKEHLDLPKEHLDLPNPEEEGEHEVKTLLSWSSAGRPFRKRAKQYYLTSLLIMFLVEIVLFLFSQYMLMVLVVSLVFVAFALATVPPRDFKYRVSTEGITIEDHFFLWQELYDFYFKKREGTEVLHIRTHALLPGELTITLGDIGKDRIKSALLPHLPYREVMKPTFMEKSGDWLTRTFPLEKPHKTSEKVAS